MLVLSRQIGEELVIDGNIRVKVVRIEGGRVRLGFEAPRSVRVERQEVAQGAQPEMPRKLAVAGAFEQ